MMATIGTQRNQTKLVCEIFELLQEKSSDWFDIGGEMLIELSRRLTLLRDLSITNDDKLKIVIDEWLTALPSAEFTWDGFIILTELDYLDVIKKVRELEYFDGSGSSATNELIEAESNMMSCSMSSRKRNNPEQLESISESDLKRTRLAVDAENNTMSLGVSDKERLLMVKLDTFDHREVYIASTVVSAAQWRDVGIVLGLSENTLDTIQADNPCSTMNCLSAVITAWLERPERDMSVPPSWRNLYRTLSQIDKPLAERISEEHSCNNINPILVIEVTVKSRVIPPAFLSQSCGCGHCTINDWMHMTGNKCQNVQDDRRPKLLVVNPGNPDVKEFIEWEQDYSRQARLTLETSYLFEQFRTVRFKTWKYLQQCFKEGRFQIPDVASDVVDKPRLPVTSQIHELYNWFYSLNSSWFNFRALQFVADTFLSEYPDLMATWSEYRSAFKEYCSARNLKSFMNVFFQVDEDQDVFLFEVDEKYYDFTRSDIEALCDSLSLALGVSPVCLYLVTVGNGSL